MQQAGFAWLVYALMTVFAWGAYGNLLHTGQLGPWAIRSMAAIRLFSL